MTNAAIGERDRLPVEPACRPVSAGSRAAIVIVSTLVFLVLAPFAKAAARGAAGVHPDLSIGAPDQRPDHRGFPARAMPIVAVARAKPACRRLSVHRVDVGRARAHFPGVFAPAGLLDAGPQTTAWLYMFWHGGFPLFVIAYALHGLRRAVVAPGQRRDPGHRRMRSVVLVMWLHACCDLGSRLPARHHAGQPSHAGYDPRGVAVLG